MLADLYFTTDSFFLLLLILFVSYPRSSLNGTQPYPATWSEVSAIWKRISEIWVTLPHTNRGSINHLFSTISQLKGSFSGLYLRNKTWYRQSGKRIANYTRSLLHRLKITWTLVNKRLRSGGEFSATVCKFCIPLHCQASQTKISKRNSSKLCQTVDGESR